MHDFYHGSNVVVTKPKLIDSVYGKDFGVVFCTDKALQGLKYITSYEVI